MKENTSKQQVALVTGASSGMGKDFAQALLAEGLVVYTVARRIEKMANLERLGAIPLKMDITDREQIDAVIETIEKDHGGIDLLINNAGFGMYGAMEETSIDDARYQFEVNLFGLAYLTQRVIPSMRTKGNGKIINVSSIGGKVYTPLGSWYHATKHALEGWSDCLRLELRQFGIDVVIIEPGAIKTEFGEVMTGPMIERSGHGPYAGLTESIVKLQRTEYEQGGGSEPGVITKLVLKAVRAKKPKTRYAAGKYAATLLFVRKWFSDRSFDRLIMSMVK
ncbi:MAG: SDR family NAD(P)-dependent oxidoreductase [Candidatus Thiodiazotropha sp. (ex. Lucinisca nassula)]|uniref:oxidoreductase n=1 Tax=Candidatus Thiodiazotropha sp. LNASS1 TaxID=3096260 RepID=UPI002814137C|nr:SDR family NAD(P)-dependent oxidoreductase [Candidatus Thiodiazotropha sp. (ex. Lucinisca nassula)]